MRPLNYLLAAVSVALGVAAGGLAADLAHGLVGWPRPVVSLPVGMGLGWLVYSVLYKAAFGQAGGAE